MIIRAARVATSLTSGDADSTWRMINVWIAAPTTDVHSTAAMIARPAGQPSWRENSKYKNPPSMAKPPCAELSVPVPL